MKHVATLPSDNGVTIRMTLDGKKVYTEQDESGDLVLVMQGEEVHLDHNAIERVVEGIEDKTLRRALHDTICCELVETLRLAVLKTLFK